MMNRVYLTAGVVIVIGVFVMIVGQVLFMASSNNFWKYNYGPYDLQAAEGEKRDQYTAITFFGLIIMGLGISIMAFGLASQRPSQLQFREVPSHIPLEQYPQPPQPPQSP